MNALIVGKGRIGYAVAREWESRGGKASFFTSKDDRSQFVKRAESNDIVFLAIPTRDNGEIALEYINDSVVEARKPIVTCEKGAFAYHFKQIK